MFFCIYAFFFVLLCDIFPTMAGIYIHIPFCKSRCKYCDFFSTTHLEKRAQYVAALLEEWRMRAHEVKEPVHTIYIGGGTPSTLAVDSLKLIVDSLLLNVESQEQEITMEVNPGDVTAEKAHAWRAIGINRLSIGIQKETINKMRRQPS